MSSRSTGSVAVIAHEGGDRQMMSQLLLNAGYDAGLINCSDSFDTASNSHSAMIVCHRRSNAMPQPGLPKCAGDQRLVVFSDCLAEQTVVNALENGAHHFFNIAESPELLQARLAAALRQHALQTKRSLDVSPFKFNLERRSVYKNNKLINLSPKEYEFAYYLFANRHRVVINAELMTSVWSLPSSMDARRIDTAACRVRKKMNLGEASNEWSLKRIRGVGYELLWCGEPQAQDAGVDLHTAEPKSTAASNRVKVKPEHASSRALEEPA